MATSGTLTRQDTVTAGLYQRVSTTDQDTARQHASNRAAAAAHGWSVREYNDDGIGASSRSKGKHAGANRPDYRAMVADVMAGALDVLVVHDVSRADRQLETWAPLLAQCRRHGVMVHVTSDDETYDPRKANHWRTLAMAGVQAEADSLGKGDMIRDGIAYWRTQGHPHGRPTYGIMRVKDARKARNSWVEDVPDPDAAPIVRRIVLAVGAAEQYAAIARALAAEHVPTPRGGTWNASTVAKIAGRPDYVRVGIVTQQEHDAARAVVDRTRGTGRGSGTRAQTWKYSGVLHCYRCGAACRGSNRRGGHYRCPNGHVAIPSDQVDVYCDAWAIARLSRADLADIWASDGGADAAAARAEVATLKAKLAAWLDDPDITPGEFKRVKARLQPQIDAAARRATQATAPGALAGLPGTDPDMVRARWDSLTVQARRAAMLALTGERALLKAGTRDGRTSAADRLDLVPDGDL